MWPFLLKLLGGNLFGTIADDLRKAYEDKLAAQNNEQRVDADKRITELQAKRDVLVAESKSPLNALMRGLLATPVVVLLWKVLVYDLALGEWTGGRTDAIPGEFWTVVMVVTGFYFVHDWVSKR